MRILADQTEKNKPAIEYNTNPTLGCGTHQCNLSSVFWLVDRCEKLDRCRFLSAANLFVIMCNEHILFGFGAHS